MLYRFDNVEFDAAACRLSRGGQELPLQRKVFDVLQYLIEHRDRVVSKDELLQAIWNGEHVNESAVPWTVSHVRRALGQDRGSRKPIETIHGRGYRFTSDVELVHAPLSALGPVSAAPAVLSGARARPFVGRADVMRRLQVGLNEALQGHGRLFMLSGEAGIGKTRCAEELMAQAVGLGFSGWIGRSIDDAGAPVFWPWMQILREALRTRAGMRELGQPLLARLAALEPGNAASNEVALGRDALARRFWLLDEVTRLLLTAAQSAPIMLLIDDVQWADVGTLNLLDFLAPELSGARLLVVVTQRSETGVAGKDRLSRLARYADRIELTHLTAQDVGRYIGALTTSGELATPLSSAVHRATTGNPLFVQETVLALISEYGENALPSLAATAVKLPEVARDVLRTRVQVLDVEARKLLSLASVLGESFELSLLQAMSGLSLSSLLELIEAATRHGLLSAETPHRYRFFHALIRELLYDEIATAERVALHRKAGEILESLQSPEPRYSEIAHHFYRSLPAGDYARVAAFATRAARAAEIVFAQEDAVRFYGWALEAQALDPGIGPRERAELLFACGRAQLQVGRERDGRETLARLVEIARAHGYLDLLTRVARMVRPTFAMSRVSGVLVREALEEVLRIAKEGPNAERVLALSQLACITPYADDLPRSKQLSAEALALARQLGERPSLFEALRSRLYALSGPDDTDALHSVVNEIIQLDQDRPTMKSIEAYSARAGAYLYRGDNAAAIQALEAMGSLARQVRLPGPIYYADRQRAQRAFLAGDFSAAQAALPDLDARCARLGLNHAEVFVDVLRTLILIERDGVESLDPEWLNFSRFTFDPPPYIRARQVRGAAELGRRDAGLAGLDAIAAQRFQDLPKDISYLNVLANISLAAVAFSDRERAEQLYALLSPYPHHSTPDPLLFDEGSVSRYLALLAACLGRHEQVEAHFEEALNLNRRMRRRSQIARTLVDYAGWRSRERREPGRAQALACEAIEIANELGMAWLATRARPLAG